MEITRYYVANATTVQVSAFVPDCTIIEGTGIWQGKAEPCAVIIVAHESGEAPAPQIVKLLDSLGEDYALVERNENVYLLASTTVQRTRGLA